MYKQFILTRSKLKNFAPKILLCAQVIVLSIRNANIVFVRTSEELAHFELIILGRAMTKTFIHIPLMGANPIGFK